MSLDQKLDKILEKFANLGEKISDPGIASSPEYGKLMREHSELSSLVEIINDYKNANKKLEEAREIAADKSMDKEMVEMAEMEIPDLKASIEDLNQKLKIALLPKDDADSKNAILEIRAGSGGEEAALFGAVLLRMYEKYADKHGWKFELLAKSDTGLDGIKEATATIAGTDVFARMKFESGVHRVQRVPETESSGRIHTSAATVAVLPEAEEVDIEINESDLRIDLYRASGAGGQHVNTTESAVRITHIPTGVVVAIQDEKSQHKNKAKAMNILRSRVYDAERQKKAAERSDMRKSMVGSGDRSERIRTYNYQQGRVTDHRINLTLYNLSEVVNEGNLDEVIDALIAQDQADKLAADMK